MNTTQAVHLLKIITRAESQRKGDYRVYESLKQEIEGMGLSCDEYEKAIKNLAKKLRV